MNIFIVEVVSLDNETQQNNSRIEIVSTDSVSCIQCDLTIKELIRLIKGRRTLTEFTYANRRLKSS